MGPWSEDRWLTGRTSQFGGVEHAIQRRPIRPGEFVAAACGQIAEVGDVNPHRHGMHPRVCATCVSAVNLTETLIEQYDRRNP